MKIGRIRKGSTLRMACSGRGCPFRARTVKLRRNQRKLTLAHPLGDARLARGTRFTVTITRQGMTGIVARYTMRVKRFPARTDRCLPRGRSTRLAARSETKVSEPRPESSRGPRQRRTR